LNCSRRRGLGASAGTQTDACPDALAEGIQVAFVYGSVAKGTDTARSDVDLVEGPEMTSADVESLGGKQPVSRHRLSGVRAGTKGTIWLGCPDGRGQVVPRLLGAMGMKRTMGGATIKNSRARESRLGFSSSASASSGIGMTPRTSRGRGVALPPLMEVPRGLSKKHIRYIMATRYYVSWEGVR